MRSFAFMLVFGVGCATVAGSETQPPMGSRMFCDYVADFAAQIARNKIRHVPFLRLDEFNYFDQARSRFLRQTAEHIYSQQPEDLRRSLDVLGDTYARECRNAFD